MPAEISVAHSKAMRYLLYVQILFLSILYTVNVALLIPLYASLSSDVIFESSLLPFVLEAVIDILDIAGYLIAYSTILYAFYFLPTKKAILVSISAGSLALIRRIASLGMEIAVSGSIGSDDIQSTAFYFALELALVVAITGTSFVFFKKENSHYPASGLFSTKYSDDFLSAPSKNKFLSFRTQFQKKSAPRKVALTAALLLSGMKVISRIIYDIAYAFLNGFPQKASEVIKEIVVMVIYYGSDILIGIIAYYILLVLVKHYHIRIYKKLT